MKKKIIFIAPGGVRYYRKFIKLLKENNFDIYVIDLKWEYKIITDWVSSVRKEVDEIGVDKNTIICGHSVGGAVAIILGQYYKIKKIISFSPSPVFDISVKFLNKTVSKVFGKKRLLDAKNNFKIRKIDTKLLVPIEIYVGEEEHPIMIKNSEMLHRYISLSKLNIVTNKNHGTILDGNDLDYQEMFI